MRRLAVAMVLVCAVGCGESEVNNLFPGTPSSAPDATAANGPYAGDGRVTMNECAFNATVSATGTINVNKDGQGTWTKIHVSAGGVVFHFNITLKVISATSATFLATTQQDIGNETYDVTDTGTLAGNNALTVTQKFTRHGKPCTTVYNLTFRKQ
jgi:hypothetical protein